MILVATINMVVALLVLILERTQMIGILKAGANNWVSVRSFFTMPRTLFSWIVVGNGIGIAILLLQNILE
jgi:lipoprotein-releasing system permease protein